MFLQYPPKTTGVYSYIEARGGRFPITLMFGLQAYIKNYLLTPITMKDIDEAEVMWQAHGLPFNRSGWEYIISKHGGLLPVRINAVPEGTVVPYKNVLCTVENTDPECFWVTTWLETSLLRAIWYPTTVSTQSKTLKNIIKGYLEETGDVNLLPFKLHDFGARGVSSLESAGLGGAAHLVNFMGSDTMSGVLLAREFYNADIAGYSIPASEHSTITSWGKAHEVDAYRNMVTQFGQTGKVLAVVSDSYDIYNAVRTLWGEELRAEVIASGATVVIRPDSGDPKSVCSSLVDILGEKFGHTVNAKGYKVLNNVRLIQGDGVNEETIRVICEDFKTKGDFDYFMTHSCLVTFYSPTILFIHLYTTDIPHLHPPLTCVIGNLPPPPPSLATIHPTGWSIDNIGFGMGGALLQRLDRDTQQWAMKCSAALIQGTWLVYTTLH